MFPLLGWIVGGPGSSQHSRPSLVITDEACQATEVEALMPWIWNSSTVSQFIQVGDPQQLRPTVTTLGSNRDGRLANLFSEQMAMSVFERWANRGLEAAWLIEQRRAVGGLERIYNKLFDGFLKNSDATGISKHPDAQAALKWMRDRFTQQLEYAELFVNVSDGICITPENGTSRFNPCNVVVMLHEIQAMLQDGLWKESDIIVIVPYRRAVHEIRKVLHNVEIFGIRINTIDGFQGGQAKCVLIDTCLAARRNGAPGFMRAFRRINVAISRAQCQRMVFGDVNSLKISRQYESKLSQMNDSDRKAAEEKNTMDYKALQNLHDWYDTENAIRTVDAFKYTEEWNMVGTEAVEELNRREKSYEFLRTRQPS